MLGVVENIWYRGNVRRDYTSLSCALEEYWMAKKTHEKFIIFSRVAKAIFSCNEAVLSKYLELRNKSFRH